MPTSSKCRRRETCALAACWDAGCAALSRPGVLRQTPLFSVWTRLGPTGDRAPIHPSLKIEGFMHAILLRFKRHRRTPPGLCHQDGARHQETQLTVDNGHHAPFDMLARTSWQPWCVIRGH
jgi:hypothetical protein